MDEKNGTMNPPATAVVLHDWETIWRAGDQGQTKEELVACLLDEVPVELNADEVTLTPATERLVEDCGPMTAWRIRPDGVADLMGPLDEVETVLATDGLADTIGALVVALESTEDRTPAQDQALAHLKTAEKWARLGA